jgi:hypothetical protein
MLLLALILASAAWMLSSAPARGGGAAHGASRSGGGGIASSGSSTSSTSSSSSTAHRAASAVADDALREGPWLAYILLGDPHYQGYAIHAYRQTRLHNPSLRILLVVTPDFYESDIGRAWLPELAHPLRIRVVNYTMLTSDYTALLQRRYTEVWEVLKPRIGYMLPTVNHKMNLQFTQYTMERLYALHGLLHAYGLKNVVHLENDQMIYGSVADVAAAARGCGVKLAMTRIGRRMAPAVVYTADADALLDMLDFMLDSLSHGAEHAIKVAGTNWVTDMSLTAAYFDRQRAAAAERGEDESRRSITSFPGQKDGSCVFGSAQLVFDAAPLGHWCCGTFEKPKEYFAHRDGESEVRYWDREFEWRNVSETPGMRGAGSAAAAGRQYRVPMWDGMPVFNIHIHSKELHLWGS